MKGLPPAMRLVLFIFPSSHVALKRGYGLADLIIPCAVRKCNKGWNKSANGDSVQGDLLPCGVHRVTNRGRSRWRQRAGRGPGFVASAQSSGGR
jgi:hypothetical protein